MRGIIGKFHGWNLHGNAGKGGLYRISGQESVALGALPRRLWHPQSGKTLPRHPAMPRRALPLPAPVRVWRSNRSPWGQRGQSFVLPLAGVSVFRVACVNGCPSLRPAYARLTPFPLPFFRVLFVCLRLHFLGLSEKIPIIKSVRERQNGVPRVFSESSL